jgi:hypothetical protein
VDNFANKRDVGHFCRAPCGRINPSTSPQRRTLATHYQFFDSHLNCGHERRGMDKFFGPV